MSSLTAAPPVNRNRYGQHSSDKRSPRLPEAFPADPEAGWATRNPSRAMLFLYVSPRDCSAIDELLAL